MEASSSDSAPDVVGATHPNGAEELDKRITQFRSLRSNIIYADATRQATYWRFFRDMLHQRFRGRPTAEDLEEALFAAERALALTSPEHRVNDLFELAFMKNSRFEISSVEADLNDAITYGIEARQLASASQHPQRWDILNNLGYSFSTRFQWKESDGKMSDLEEAIKCGREVVNGAPRNHAAYHTAVSNISTRLALKAMKTGTASDRDDALEANRLCIESGIPGSPQYIAAQQNLAQILLNRYDETGFWRDLEESIRLQYLAVNSSGSHIQLHPKARNGLATSLMKKYTQTKNVADLKEAVRVLRDAVLASPPFQSMQSTRGLYLLQYITHLNDLMALTTEATEIEQAIKEALGLHMSMPTPYRQILSVEFQLGKLMSRKYELSSDPMDFARLTDHAMAVASQAEKFGGRGPGKPPYDVRVLLQLVGRGRLLASSAQDDYLVIQMTKAMHKEYCKLIGGPQDYIDCLIKLEKDVVINVQVVGISTRDKPFDVVEKELEVQAKFAISLGAKAYQYRIKMLDMVVSFDNKMEDTKAISDLSTALEALHMPGSSEPLTEEKQTGLLGLALTAYRETVKPDKLPTVLRGLKELARMRIGDSKAQAHLLDLLADVHLRSYMAGKNLEELKLATAHTRESLALFDNEAYDKQEMREVRCRLLCNLCGDLRDLWLSRGGAEWLRDAHFIGEAAVRIAAVSFPTPKTSSDYLFRSSALLGLANALKSKYQSGSAFEDLEEAIETVQAAMRIDDQNPFASARERGASVNQLALMIRLRFIETGEINDLDVGIRQIEAFFEDYRGKDAEASGSASPLFSNLGLLYQTKAERTGALEDINNAIHHCDEAMRRVGEEAAAVDGSMCNLANAYLERYFRQGKDEDLDAAVRYGTMVAEKSLEIGRQQPAGYLDPASIMKAKYVRTMDANDLQQAAKWMEVAISLVQPNDRIGSYTYLEYGRLLELEWERTKSQDALRKCMEAYANAAESTSGGRNTSRDIAARSLYRLLLSQNRWEEALRHMEVLVERMTDRCPRWLPSLDRQSLLSPLHGVPSDAAGVILKWAGPRSAYRALRALELGRGMLLGSTMDFRSEAKHLRDNGDLLAQWNRLCMELDASVQELTQNQTSQRQREVRKALMQAIDAIRSISGFETFAPPIDVASLQAYQLRSISPELFEAYNSLQREFDSFPVAKEGGRHTRRPRELSSQMDAMITKIRQLPGQENFLLPPKEAEMCVLANNGPIVIFNNSDIIQQSHAIIITKSGLEALPLPSLNYQDTQRYLQAQRNALTGWTLRNLASKNKEMRDILLWLWSVAVRPVLDHLGILSRESGQRPRIHWIGTGILSAAPFHAAGDHSDDSTDNAISRVVSSYIPNLRALSFAREGPSSKELLSMTRDKRVLLVSVPEAPGAMHLPAVENEAAAVAAISEPHATVVHLKDPGPRSVLQELPLANIVHFACHATADTTDLSNSHLILMQDNDEATNPATAATKDALDTAGRLTVRNISARRAPTAELAYLSACSAAENRAGALADESIHIASAFQLAGFRHVVGTLWQAKDQCCCRIAEDFYHTLFELGEGDRGLRAPESLDRAVRMLREQNTERVLNWAPFVHIGA